MEGKGEGKQMNSDRTKVKEAAVVKAGEGGCM